ncbi:MAG TPA: thioesterase family protein [Rhizobiaceae bacterium]|nr:thioesterase family protein [Rhizobiaceae bacterium]
MSETDEFFHEIRVGWADCDPARIAYTGRIPYWCLEAIDAWWERHLGQDWFVMNVDRDVGGPFVHMTIDFRAPVTPRHRLSCAVRLIRLGNGSVRFAVRGFQHGVVCFEGEFVEAFVKASAHRAIAAPDDIRAAFRPLVRPKWA